MSKYVEVVVVVTISSNEEPTKINQVVVEKSKRGEKIPRKYPRKKLLTPPPPPHPAAYGLWSGLGQRLYPFLLYLDD